MDIVKHRKRCWKTMNIVVKLQRRETCSRPFRMFEAEKFRYIQLQEEYDTHDPEVLQDYLPHAPSNFLERSMITEIVSAHGIVIALTESGVCAAFNTETNRRICFLNIDDLDIIRSLFYNKHDDSLITVFGFEILSCRTTRIEYIRRGVPSEGVELFPTERFDWPGFIEFDDVNGKILIYSPQDCLYKVFDLKNYTMLFCIKDTNVEDVKISPGIMLVRFNQARHYIRLRILSIEDGTVLYSLKHPHHQDAKVDFIEQCIAKLLVKYMDKRLQIFHRDKPDPKEVERTGYLTPSEFLFLYESQLFLTFGPRSVEVWNFRGQLVKSIDDLFLGRSNFKPYITSDQDLMIWYLKEFEGRLTEENEGSIYISRILTGDCLAKVKATNNLPIDECSCDDDGCECNCNSRRELQGSRIGSSISKSWKDITTLFYDESRNEIYIGNRFGLIHKLSNSRHF